MTTLVCPLCRIALTPPEHICPRDGREGVEHAFAPVPAALLARFRVVMPFAGSESASLYVVDAFGSALSSSGRRGVLKLLRKPQKARDQEQVRVRRELEKQRALDCPYLVVPWQSGESDGTTWVFRRWLDGVSLRVSLARNPVLAQREALGIAAQLTVALAALHAQGLLHRDIHPGHLFLEARPGLPARVQLLDAGLPFVRYRTDGPPQLGSPGYAAPEQLLGKLVSMRSDLYSAGVVFAEILQGHKLFEADTPDALLAAQLRAGRPTMSDTLAESIRGMVDALLSTDPQRRPFSAQKLRRTLDAYLLEGAPMTRQPTSPFTTLRPDGAPGTASARSDDAPDAAPEAKNALPSTTPPAVAATEAAAPVVGPRPSYEPTPARTTLSAGPPPPPAAALNGARARLSPMSPMPPMVRPSSRAPLPPPPSRKREPDLTQQLDDGLLEELAPKALPPALPVRPQAAPARPQHANEDYTVPVRLDQILAVSQAPARAPAIPPLSPAPSAAPAISQERALAPVGRTPEAHLGTLFDPASMTEAARAAGEAAVPLTSTIAVGVAHDAPATEGTPASAVAETAEAPTGDFGPVAAHKPTSLGMPNPLTVAASPAPESPALEKPPAPESPAAHAEAAIAEASLGTTAPVASAPNDVSDDVTTVMPSRPASQPPQNDAAASPATLAAAHAPGADPVADTLAQAIVARAPGKPRELTPDDITQPVRELQSSLRPPTDDEQRRKLMMYAGAAAAALLIGFGGRTLFGGGAPDDTVDASRGQAQLAGTAPEAEPPTAAPARVEPPREMPKLADLDAPNELPAAVTSQLPAQPATLPTPIAKASAERAEAIRATPAAPIPTVNRVIPAVVVASTDTPPAKNATAIKGTPIGTRSKETGADAPRRERTEKAARAEKPKRADKTPESNATKWAAARDEARAFYAERQYQKAADAYERATRFDPQNPGTYAGLGAARLQLNNARGAVDAYGKAVQLSPNTAGFHAALGRAYASANDPTRAKASYKRALALDPQNQNIAAALKALD